MALIICPECEKEISDKTKACPHCGFPISEQSQQDAKMVPDIEEISKEEISANDQICNAPSFWSYTAAKILLSLVILSLCLSSFSIYTSSKTTAIEQRVQDIENSSKYTSSKTSAIEQRVQDIENSSKEVLENLQLVKLGIGVSEGVVTDKAVIQRAVFYSFIPGEIMGSIDIRPQPTYSNKFLGQGNFDLSDRELRSMLEELISKLVTFVGNDYNFKTISITANNYAVAEYKDGVITLAGE